MTNKKSIWSVDNRIELIKGITCHDENNFQIFNCILPCDNEKFHSNPAICSYRTLRDVSCYKDIHLKN